VLEHVEGVLLASRLQRLEHERPITRQAGGTARPNTPSKISGRIIAAFQVTDAPKS
jgi:hypothetical protein